MHQVIEGGTSAVGLRIGVIASRFNEEIVVKLLEGALDCLNRHGADSSMIEIYRVPGAFEIPALASRLADLRRFNALIALGVLIRGETPHFDYISSQVTHQISRVSVETRLPVSFGVLTCDTLEQAEARTRKGSNKGWEAALAAVEMANLYRTIGS